MTESSLTPAEIVQRCERVMAHAWMIRTFIKHCEEVEDFPELMNVARSIFDVSRALETRVDDPPRYFHMLRKKIGRLGRAVNQFREDAAAASDHMNFRQAVSSSEACVLELREWLDHGEAALSRARQESQEEKSQAVQSDTIEQSTED